MRSLIVLAAFAAMVASNVFANSGAFGEDNKTLSDSNPTYITPDGATFAVWGIIYTLQLAMVIAQLKPSESTDKLLSQACPVFGFSIRMGIAFNLTMNALWLPVFNSNHFLPALAIMGLYLAGLVAVYMALSSSVTSAAHRVLFVAPIATNASWIVVAFSVNAFFCLRKFGWQDAYGVGGSVPAALAVIILVIGIGCYQGAVSRDFGWGFVAAWALQGIYRMQSVPDAVRFPPASLSSTLAEAAWWGSVAVSLAALLGVALALKSKYADFQSRSDATIELNPA